MCLLVGVAEAGKTHVKHLLFRWALPESRNSTPLAARPIQAIRVNTQGGQLQEVDPDRLGKILANTVATGVHLKKRSFFQNLCCIMKTEKINSKAQELVHLKMESQLVSSEALEHFSLL